MSAFHFIFSAEAFSLGERDRIDRIYILVVVVGALETVENPKSPITKRELIGCQTFRNDEKSKKPVEKSRCFFDVIHQNESENEE